MRMRRDTKKNAQIQQMRAPAIEIANVTDRDYKDGAIADKLIETFQRLSKSDPPFFGDCFHTANGFGSS